MPFSCWFIREPGDVRVVDDFAGRESGAMCAVIRAAGARRIFRPTDASAPVSITQVLADLEAPLRKAAKRSAEGIWTCIRARIGRFPPDECAAHLRHAGCASI